VVLPWSTWATIATFRRSERTGTQKHSPQVVDNLASLRQAATGDLLFVAALA
jgi:hypothetical protein